MTIKRALLSVSDKTGIIEFARALAAAGIELLSTGGTFKAIRDAGIAVTEVKDVTGFPEIMDGRVKTLHPKIHGGLLADRDVPAHLEAMVQHGIKPIDMLVVNLYPFRETVASGADFDECIENIDIGGPAMIRAAAKNHKHVLVVTDPKDYDVVITSLRDNTVTSALRRALAEKAFRTTGEYDAAVGGWFYKTGDWEARVLLAQPEPANPRVNLRYGENPHQKAHYTLSDFDKRPGVLSARQVQGKELSYNNINDTDAAFECVAEFDRPAVAIIKHANPCGVAEGNNLFAAYQLALRCDPVSAFGGIVAMNRPLDAAAARAMIEVFTEVIIAPGADQAAMDIIASKKNLRLLLTEGMPDPAQPGIAYKTIAGGDLCQDRDNGRITAADLRCVTKKQPSEKQIQDMLFAWRVAKHVKSNAIVYVKDLATVGIGAGQMSRVDSSRIAAHKAAEAAQAAGLAESLAIGSVVASDAFFPFPDGLLAAASAGATAVIQPGGSMRDNEVIAAADEAGLAMVFTGMRHFRH